MRDFFSKKSLLIPISLCLTAAAPARIVLHLSAPRQAQFAGYYVAEARGFYARAGLAVTIRQSPPESDDAPPAPGADIWSAPLGPALAAAASGLALTNIAQIFHHPALALFCRRDSGIRSPTDFHHHRIGVWPGIPAHVIALWLAHINNGEATIVPTPRLPGLAGVAPLLSQHLACLTGLTYDQGVTLTEQGTDPKTLTIFPLAEYGLAPPADGLWVRADTLSDPEKRALYTRFLAASLAGWRFALSHPKIAVTDTLGATPASEPATLRQTRMFAIVAKLMQSSLQRLGYLEPAAYSRAITMLLPPPPKPLSAWPEHAYTHQIWRDAEKQEQRQSKRKFLLFLKKKKQKDFIYNPASDPK